MANGIRLQADVINYGGEGLAVGQQLVGWALPPPIMLGSNHTLWTTRWGARWTDRNLVS